jgi:hypothetical protein
MSMVPTQVWELYQQFTTFTETELISSFKCDHELKNIVESTQNHMNTVFIYVFLILIGYNLALFIYLALSHGALARPK